MENRSRIAAGIIGSRKNRRILIALLVLGCVAPAILYAEHTRTWRESSYSDFEKGTAKGVAIRSDGKLAPAPKFSAFSDPNLAYLWSLRLDSRGRVYGAGGSDAKVVRFDDPAKPTTVFEAPELSAQAIAFDAHENLFVGTSPDGKIYRVTADGQKSVFFEPKTKYIWALAIDAQGTVFCGDGRQGARFSPSHRMARGSFFIKVTNGTRVRSRSTQREICWWAPIRTD